MPGQHDPQRALRICIIGAGSSGLVSARQMLDEGFDPVIYERSTSIGGLWVYHNDDVDGMASVMRSTIINTSKEMSAFSDFPPPKDAPNFMHNTKMLAYFRSYADHFGITERVHLRHDVLQVTPATDYEATGRWEVKVKDLNSGTELQETFDAVMVCVGHHVFPNVPKFRGQEKFKGRITHTHSIKVPDQFKDRRVAVVGIGNSGVDAVVDVSHVAAQTYLSTRRGGWIARRVGPNGVPIDAFLSTRLKNYIRHLLPESVTNEYAENFLNGTFNHEAYGLKPKHRYNAQHPTMNDSLPNKILSGFVLVKKDIVEFTEDGVLFEGDDEVTKLDDVILATGYQIKFPMLPKDVVSVVDNQVQIYKYVFPPGLKHPTLAIMGLIQPVGAIFPIVEMQARWMAQLLAGNRKLPSEAEMYDDIARKRAALRRRYVDSPRHTIQVDWIDYMDELADQFGARPKILKYLFTDYELFKALLGPCVPYQFRLEGPHSWAGARDAVLGARERIHYPLNRNCTSFSTKKGVSPAFYMVVAAFVIFIAYLMSS
ncbi:flavin-containing monooxygenase 5 [Ixodes scapularis]|uniref:flavin-containing monooxygenase 5 n=1 Tax=Ixodes scapularis TaxID=6945 RepID=UPI001A9E1345|nr:flavin-containing monooxygenase 5 [Ixodes scapularis]XP_029843022.2 flavin-containing monooxygenase 5 [Ixodes scapularis]